MLIEALLRKQGRFFKCFAVVLNTSIVTYRIIAYNKNVELYSKTVHLTEGGRITAAMDKKIKQDSYDISVIIPIYKVEEYIRSCLDSLLRQGDVRLQVIMVDDGTPDNSGRIADEYAEEYENFFAYHKANSGPGNARNYGVQLAEGKYLAFLDPDDILVDRIYEKMFLRAEKDGSDLTICNAARFDSSGIVRSSQHDVVFRTADRITNIRDNHDLLYDTTSWNKLILRSFYLANHFRFPEGILYEDIPLMTPIHFMASRVSMVHEVGYMWRRREDGIGSITQNKKELSNLLDRLKAMKMLQEYLAENANHEAMVDYVTKTLTIDLMTYINLADSVEDEYMELILSKVNDYLDKYADDEVMKKLTLINRQKYIYVKNHDLAMLRKLCKYQKASYYKAPVTERDGHLFVEPDKDLFTISDMDITDDIKRGQVNGRTDNITIDEDGIKLRVHLYRKRVSIGKGEQKVKAYLYDELTGNKVPFSSSYFDDEDFTKKYGSITDNTSGTSSHYCYDGAGTDLSLSFGDTELLKSDGDYKILIESENRFYKDSFFLSVIPHAGIEKTLSDTFFAGGKCIRMRLLPINQINITVSDDPIAEECSMTEGTLKVSFDRPTEQIMMVDEMTGESIPLKNVSPSEYIISAVDVREYGTYRIMTASGKPVYRKDSVPIIDDEADIMYVAGTNKDHSIRVVIAGPGTTVVSQSRQNMTVTINTSSHIAPFGDDLPVAARLCFSNIYTCAPYELAESKCMIRDDMMECSFEVDFQKD